MGPVTSAPGLALTKSNGFGEKHRNNRLLTYGQRSHYYFSSPFNPLITDFDRSRYDDTDTQVTLRRGAWVGVNPALVGQSGDDLIHMG